MNRITPDGEWMGPVIEEAGISFTYGNTQVRTFGPEFAHLNHVEHYPEPGRVVGHRMSPQFLQRLIEASYPRLHQYFPDKQTVEWWVTGELEDIQQLDQAGLPDSFSDQA